MIFFKQLFEATWKNYNLLTNYLSMFDHFVGLALKLLKYNKT